MSLAMDPVTFQVVWSRLVSVADEIAGTLVKTAFSLVVRDNHDYACGLYDSKGRMLAQSTQCTPGASRLDPQGHARHARALSARKSRRGRRSHQQ